jgi:hypothetical protein
MGIKSVFAAMLAFGMTTIAGGDAVVTEVYSLRLYLKVPQVRDNSLSTGRRVYVRQRLEGEMYVTYSADSVDIAVVGLVNRNFKVGGKNVGYQVFTGVTCWNLIGDNRTGIFRRPSVCFSMEAQPSYAWSWEPDSDNSFVLTLSGFGTSYRVLHGYVSGTQGCGCAVFGHKSPTRRMGPRGQPLQVSDVAATFGTWHARLKGTSTDS